MSAGHGFYEGAASLLEPVSENARTGAPIDIPYRSCPSGTTIAELEALYPGFNDPEFACNYYLGGNVFLDLYNTLGKETFRQGFLRLYLKSQQDDPEDDCEGVHLGICHVEAAFKAGASDDVVAQVDEILDRWYGPRP